MSNGDGQAFDRVPADQCDACQIVREADHRIANHLSLLAAYVHLRAADLARRPDANSGADAASALQAISTQIITIAELHRRLSALGGQTQPLHEHLHAVCAALSTLGDRVEILEEFSPGCAARADQILPILQIVSEVLTNGAKHAHAPDGRARLVARCFNDQEGRVQIEIVDKGPGLPADFDLENSGGLGFGVLQSCAKQLQADIVFDSSPAGLRFRLSLPVQVRVGA